MPNFVQHSSLTGPQKEAFRNYHDDLPNLYQLPAFFSLCIGVKHPQSHITKHVLYMQRNKTITISRKGERFGMLTK